MGEDKSKPQAVVDLKQLRRAHKKIIGLFWVLITVVCVLILFTRHASKAGGLDWGELADSFVSDAIGVLMTTALFGCLYEFFVREYYAEEISAHIVKTFKGDAGSLTVLSRDARVDLLKATLASLDIDMVSPFLEPYLNAKYNVRKNFNYGIRLRECSFGSPFNRNEYADIDESLSYTEVFIAKNGFTDNFRMGFFMDGGELDRELKKSEYVFREKLTVKPEHLQILCERANVEGWSKGFVEKKMQLSVFVDNQKAAITDVEISERGIDIGFTSAVRTENRISKIKITFNMPQLKNRPEFLVALSVPTYAPHISFSYDYNTVDVEMYPFLNSDERLVDDSTYCPGISEINLPEEWIYPYSGVVFTVLPKAK